MCSSLCEIIKTSEYGVETPWISDEEKFKTGPSAGKIMLTIFADTHRPIIVEFRKKEITISSASYSEMLEKKPKPAICSKRRGLLSKKVLYLHDNY
ncbi:hypothetical protein AVEN_217770-1 [Araneus ventricosus]|uniref:Uncharacterized protein n=1 Tax=Araneus ventricosus TaxID=182803 RepID=A0A4Y2Q6J1_ARAVE|nr:hypothetical protein AVEN_217770-1 [Araneus ventricosus]